MKDPVVSSPDIFPPPVSQSFDSRHFSIFPYSFDFQLAHTVSPDADLFLAKVFLRHMESLFAWGPAAENVYGGPDGTITRCFVDVSSSDMSLSASTIESYTIQVGSPQRAASPLEPQNVTITATTVFGALRALESLTHLVTYNYTSRSFAVAGTTVQDQPRFEFRGVMVDAARNFMELSALRQLVDGMSFMKLNVLHLHLSDDQSWPLEIVSYPRLSIWGSLTNYSHSYSQVEMKSFVQYAYERGVRIIPEFDFPGHSSKLCQAYPEYCAHWIDDDGHEEFQLIDPTNEQAWIFLERLHTEIASIFISDEVHIGGDEVWTVPWEQDPDVQQWMVTHNSSCPDNPALACGTVTGLLHYFFRREIGILAKLGKKALGWAPGIDNFNSGDSGNEDYSNYSITLDNWIGFDPPGAQYWQDQQNVYTKAHAHVILSGPFYLVDRWPNINDGNRFAWHDMYHSDPQNFTGSVDQMSLVRGAKLCIWDDAARTDSANLPSKAGLFLEALGESLWVGHGRIDPSDQPQDYFTSMRFKDHRCRLLRRGFVFEPVEFISIPCPVEQPNFDHKFNQDSNVKSNSNLASGRKLLDQNQGLIPS